LFAQAALQMNKAMSRPRHFHQPIYGVAHQDSCVNPSKSVATLRQMSTHLRTFVRQRIVLRQNPPHRSTNSADLMPMTTTAPVRSSSLTTITQYSTLRSSVWTTASLRYQALVLIHLLVLPLRRLLHLPQRRRRRPHRAPYIHLPQALRPLLSGFPGQLQAPHLPQSLAAQPSGFPGHTALPTYLPPAQAPGLHMCHLLQL
jgi:hypothetical protein